MGTQFGDSGSADDYTIPSRKNLLSTVKGNEADSSASAPRSASVPWVLQQYFDGDIDLDAELSNRFTSMPLMSLFHTRQLEGKHPMQIATLSAQDGAATVLFEMDVTTKALHLTTTFGSMLSLRFRLDNLSTLDRRRWLELMRGGDGALAFLWGQNRWEADYVICAAHRYFTNIYAFSATHAEAAVRLTPEVTRKLLDWLERLWKTEHDTPPNMW